MNIQWYPGHMTKARRAMEENMKLVDVIVEVRDARLPASSANPDLEKLGKNKKRILLLNKADLADPAVTEQWEAYYAAKGYEPVLLDAREKKRMNEVRRRLSRFAEEKQQKDAKRGILNRSVRIMVAGIPNVGKSTFINSLAGRASTKTGDKPGVTKGIQWIRLGTGLELMDTPGILWPKFEDEQVGIRLALAGTIHEEILPLEELCTYGFQLLQERYPQAVSEAYGIRTDDPHVFLSELAQSCGFLQKGGGTDTARAAKRFLDDWQKGKLGRISLENPPAEETVS